MVKKDSEKDAVTISAIPGEKHLEDVAPDKLVLRNVGGMKWGLVVLSMLSATFLFSLDNTIVADVQPSIIRHFNALDKLTWLSVAFLLGASSTNLFWGQCYANFNAKWVYILCVTIFEIGSALCGGAPTMDVLVLGRAICGLGGAGMYTGVMVLISLTTTEQERPMYFGFCGLTWGGGTILGPILGGAFSDSNATWRWAFFINLVIGAACAPVYILLLPSKPVRGGPSFTTRLLSIDIIGTLLLSGTFASLIMAMSFGGTSYTWSNGHIGGLFGAAGGLAILFLLQQGFTIGTTKETRLFPLDFLKKPIMIMMFLATACASVAIFIPVYFIPLYFQFVKGKTALGAGVELLPYVVFNVVTAILNGGIMSKKPYYMPWYLFAGVLVTAGSALMLTVNEFTAPSKIWGYSILLGVGAGAYVQLSFTVIQCKVERQRIPVAVGFCTCAQLAGPTFALCISNAVFVNESTDALQKLIPQLSRAEIQAAIAGAVPRQALGLTIEVQAAFLDVVVKAISKTYALSLSAGALTVLMALCMKRERLSLKATDEVTE